MKSLTSKRTGQLKDVLKRLYAKYNHFELIKPDPLQFVYKYSNPRDMEIAAFLAAGLAYGRVQQIEKSLENLLGRMGDSPFEFVLCFDKDSRGVLADFKHRFTSGEDISDLLELLRDVLRQHSSIEKYFLQFFNSQDENVLSALSNFCGSLLEKYADKHNGSASRGLRYLLARPSDGSVCKRLNLFLRWMVRDDEVDTGLWKSVEPAKLIVPVDVHMARLCKILGLYQTKTVILSSAVKITKGFAQINPADPVKYDFALSRIGIVEDCNGSYRLECEDCELLEFCAFK